MHQRDFIELISGRKRGTTATLFRFVLWYASLWYALVIVIRLGLYRIGALGRTRVEKPVICVGNITTGGTGKTPAVATVVRLLTELGAKPAIVSRGYRADAGGNDEMKVLTELCPPSTPHVQNPDRIEGARQAIKQGASVIVLDDGFSHLRLARDLDVLLIDALNPFGFGRMLPRGLMREPMRSLRRAGLTIFTRADVAGETRLRELEDTVRCYGYTGEILHAAHVPTGVFDLAGGSQPLESLKDKIVCPFCGIGNPVGFERTLTGLGAKISPLGMLRMDDHAFLDARELTRQIDPFIRTSFEQGAQIAICTQKDAVKLRGRPEFTKLLMPIFELRVEFRIIKGEEALIAHLKALVAAKGKT